MSSGSEAEIKRLEPRRGDDDGWRRARHVWRSTLGLQKLGGEWQVSHSHTSVPFDTETSRALLDLRP